MSKLERWLPFKFLRRSKEEKQTETARSRGRDVAVSPGATKPGWSMAPDAFFSTPMNQLMQSFFNDPFFRDPFGHSHDLDRWFGDFSPARFQPTIDVVDEEDALCVSAELPGMSRDDVEVEIDRGVLTLRGEKKHEEEKHEKGVYRGERYYGYFQRTIPLPAELDEDGAQAEFADGVLKVRLPKIPEASEKTRRIPIG